MCAIVAITTPVLKKTDNPFAVGGVLKISHCSGILKVDYEKNVQAQREREQQPKTRSGKNVKRFRMESRRWGTVDPEHPQLVEHNGQWYLRIRVQSGRSEYFAADTGDPISRDALRPWFPKRSSDAARQQVENPVILRNYKLSTIAEIRFDGQRFAVAGHKRTLQKYSAALKRTGTQSRVIDA